MNAPTVADRAVMVRGGGVLHAGWLLPEFRRAITACNGRAVMPSHMVTDADAVWMVSGSLGCERCKAAIRSGRVVWAAHFNLSTESEGVSDVRVP